MKEEFEMDQDKNFIDLAKEVYQKLEETEKELGAMLSEIQKQKGPLKNYLQSLGIIEMKKRELERRRFSDRRKQDNLKNGNDSPAQE